MSPQLTTEVRQSIRTFICRNVRLNGLNDEDNLFESGIVNSLFAVQLMTFLEKNFGIEITPDDLKFENFKSILAASQFVLRKTGQPPS